jgi:hypothetical protein
MTGATSVRDYLRVFLASTFIGKMIGGISLVAIIKHAAIAPLIE